MRLIVQGNQAPTSCPIVGCAAGKKTREETMRYRHEQVRRQLESEFLDYRANLLGLRAPKHPATLRRDPAQRHGGFRATDAARDERYARRTGG